MLRPVPGAGSGMKSSAITPFRLECEGVERLPKLSLLPKDKRFSVLLDERRQRRRSQRSGLKDMVDIWENVRERVGIIADLEHEGDAITHLIMAELRRALIVPFRPRRTSPCWPILWMT